MMTTVVPALDGQLQDYLDHLTIERGVAANTLSSYRRDLRRYQEHLMLRGVHDLADVTENDVSEFLVSLRRGEKCRPQRSQTAVEPVFRGILLRLARRYFRIP